MRFSYLYGDQGAGSRTQYSNEVPAGYPSGQNSAMMDDLKDVEVASGAMNNGGGLGSGGGLGGLGGGMNRSGGIGGNLGPAGLQYSIPGILHFLQHEWARFEMERGQWEVEKAELQARIAFLQGERKGQENLKNDLVRRIKMLEYALKQERAKYAKLKYGGDSGQAIVAANALDATSKPTDADGTDGGGGIDSGLPGVPGLDSDNYITVSNVNWRQGRQLLRQYLQEIGYTDTIIDVRSNRVRSLLGLHDNNITNQVVGMSGDVNVNTDDLNNSNRTSGKMNAMAGVTVNGGDNNTSTVARRPGQTGIDSAGNRGPTTLAEEIVMDAEKSVMESFEFLNDGSEDDDEIMGEDGLMGGTTSVDDLKITGNISTTSANTSIIGGLPPGPSVHLPNVGNRQQQQAKTDQVSSSTQPLGGPGNLELGELEQLTITNDNESSYDITTPSQIRKTWNAKYTLRSHFDGVRALAFHPTEPVLITASEDQTLKLWNLQKTIPAKKSAALDVEPVYTFRAHTGPVLSLAVAPDGDYCFSGGIDATIRCWNMPHSTVDPYDSYDPNVLAATLLGHTDAVWSLSYLGGNHQQLLSASADGTVKLWSPISKSTTSNVGPQQLVKTFGYSPTSVGTAEEGNGNNNSLNVVPTAVDWVYEDPAHMVAGYNNAACIIYDIETGKSVVRMDTMQDNSSEKFGAITCVVSHPTLPLTITAHEDRHIRFFDNKTGKLAHAMVAHLDSVTSLAVDVNGLYLISGSHDCSVRLWNLETKTCVQEITAHRKKFDESIFDVAFHPSRPFIASAGADALAKVFV